MKKSTIEQLEGSFVSERVKIMKLNTIKKIFFYTVLIASLLLISEFIFCCIDVYNRLQIMMIRMPNVNKFDCFKDILKMNISEYTRNWDYTYFDDDEFRPPALYYLNNIPLNKNKKDIVLLGCSFTYGDLLENENAFHSQLSKYIHRNVYNLGLSASSPREILYIFNNPEILDKLIDKSDNIEYFIYTYIIDHKRRLYSNLRPLSPFYISDKDYKRLIYLELPSWLNHLYTIRYINTILFDNNYYKNNSLLFNLYMREINQKIKSDFKKAKFVIFVYEDDNTLDWEKLKKEGIIVIQRSDLNLDLEDSKYKVSDGHPSAKAWQVIVPALAKELNL